MYEVKRPRYEKTGEVTKTADGEVQWNRVCGWTVLGLADCFAEAYRKWPRGREYGYSHVLEDIGDVH